ncbi:MAG TPA: DivIVA domain-containing protein [Candidatus Atopostipes pullistercoris]|uniref:DivIVA domain-containing protein n=1 Tax=Candidatus Atopostipes pullistercoris TaxID=2838467 RepID=A0A9D2FZI2_9LACT|nr:DivIVA domain-containing protein [Candidatus Atopostipes pullistercoris]
MPLTPLEIHNKEFGTRMRGYDQDEVNEFLDQIIRDYELLIRQNKEVNDELEIANKKLSNYEEMQESLNKSILVAQDAADRLKENTEREIEVTKLEAEKYAENIRTEADEYAAEVNKKADEYAESVHKEADDNADALLQEAVLKARKIEDETEALRKQSRVFRQRLQLLIETQLELLTKEDWDNLLVGKPIEYPNTETIMEVEKELEEKIDLDEEEFDEESNETSLEESEVMEDSSSAEETTETDAEDDSVDTVANDEDDVYNNESQEGDYEEGTMPAVELPEAAEE